MEVLHHLRTDSCRGDGICVEICPENVLEIVNGKAVTAQARAHTCILCGQCIAICPNDALSLSEMPDEDFRDLKGVKARYEELHALLESRRSVRVFRKRPVEDETIDRLLDLAATAPMGFPPHATEVVVIRDQEERAFLLKQLVKEYTKTGKAMSSPVGRAMIRMIAGRENYHMLREHIVGLSMYANELYHRDGTDRYMYQAPAFLLFHADRKAMSYAESAHIVCTYTMLAAQSLGLGSTIIGLVPPVVDRSKLLRTRYGIPEGNGVVTSLALGYPKYSYRKSIHRTLAGVRRI